jgi:hypothetical protein
LGRTTVFADEICWTPAALHRGCVIVRSQSQAACVYVGDAKLMNAVIGQSQLATRRVTPRVPRLSTLIGLHRDDIFTVPTPTKLLRWYLWSLGILVVCAALSASVNLIVAKPNGVDRSRIGFWVLGVALGLVGTAALGRWRGEFIFTWPLVVFIAFAATLHFIPLKIGSDKNRWASRVATVLFLAACAIYFTVCRHLSLPAEWIFLTGFFAALPFLIVERRIATQRLRGLAMRVPLLLIAFSAYYWASVALLYMVY